MARRRGRPARFEPLQDRLATLRIAARRRPLMAGYHDPDSGTGSAFGQAGKLCPWMWERQIARGQWCGPWQRVRSL